MGAMDIPAMLAKWKESALAKVQAAELATATDLPGHALTVLNGFWFTAEQMNDASLILSAVREEFEKSPMTEVAFLSEYAASERLEPEDHAAAALYARARALENWVEDCDRPQRFDAREVFDAATRCELIEIDGLPSFDHDRLRLMLVIRNDDIDWE
ncbi:hypothetical protein PX554_20170 [Sphingomonas sp. H39-1-10]|uniref:hypothetical protein n=1 Tax=Sphingomonas pollutisoli TaxID=3030829 RepID=UPI0023B8C2B3|nr:hypothetical protein [Sphingomonas pollutisoli]MDF0490450.1 hypothetical protein [Sphingomonas pollutisoli]